MANRSMRILLMGLITALSFSGLSAAPQNFVWGSATGQVGTPGHSKTFLDSVDNPSKQNVNECGGRLIFENGDTLTLDGTISVSGDVVLDASQISEGQTICVNVGGDIMSNPQNQVEMINANRGYVLVRPDNADYNKSPVVDSVWSHLAFRTATNRKIEVKCEEFSLAFTDSFNTNNTNANGGNGRNNVPLHLSFWGKGQVCFRMKDGCCVVFRGMVPSPANPQGPDADAENLENPAGLEMGPCGCFPSFGEETYDTDLTNSGVKVFVMMNQSETQAENGECQLVFERYSFDPLTLQQNPKEGQPAEVWVGEYAFITYLSSNKSGELGDNYADDDGFGSIGFDPSSSANSRLVLRILGSRTRCAGDGSDGAVVICGHRIPDQEDFTPKFKIEEIARFYQLNHMAGIEANFKICDEVAFAEDPNYFNTPNSRRGLVVVNGNQTIPFFASNPYSIDRENPGDQNTAGPFGNSFFVNGWRSQINPFGDRTQGQIRNGFVLGVNGHMKLYHNTCLDYVGTTSNCFYPESQVEYGSPINGDLTGESINNAQSNNNVTKKHNPSAFIVDGLTTGIDNSIPQAPVKFPDPFMQGDAVAYTAFENGRHARITLCGDSRILLRNAKSAIAEVEADVFAYSCQGDCVFSFTIGKGPYESATDPNCPSFSVPALNPNEGGMLEDRGDAILGEGFHVLDVEGRLTVCSIDDDFANGVGRFARHDGTGTMRDGKINVPSVMIDHACMEIDCDKNRVIRPLEHAVTSTVLYPRYQSSVLYFNAPVDYPFFGAPSATFYDVNLVHNDVARAFNVPDPVLAEPAILGGSRAAFDDRFGTVPTAGVFPELPVLRFINSTLHLHETLVSSGVRFEIAEGAENTCARLNNEYNEETEQFDSDAANLTRIISYNRGDWLDTRNGRGRVFMLGTQQNLMADGFAYQSEPGIGMFDVFYNQPFPLISSFVNIYRRTQTNPNDGIPTDLIQLRLMTGGEVGFQASLNQVDQAKQIAKHLYFMANKSQTAIGWTSEVGDVTMHPWWNTPASQMQSDQFSIASFDSDFGLYFETAPAEMFIAQNFYWFGGIDGRGPLSEDMFGQARPNGNKVLKPVITPFDPRAVYVNHGGKLIAAPDIDSVWDTTIARLLSPSGDDLLSGRIDIPMDQIRFTKGHSVQPYNLNFAGGDIHLDVYNDDHIQNSVAQGGPKNCLDFASGEEVVISWLYRTENANFCPVKPVYPCDLINQPMVMSPQSQTRKNIKDEILRQTKEKNVTPTRAQGSWRSTPDLDCPVVVPTGLLFVDTNDYIRQLRVMGATCADPFHLRVTGDADGLGRIREFCTQPMDVTCELVRPVYGEGDYAALFLDGGGRIGLGSRDWNEHSLNAWSVLGWDHVTIFANGNGVVDVNSDLLIVDKLPIVATENFGVVGNPATDAPHRIEFFSEDNRVVRIPAGHEVDLCTFGRSNIPFGQQIAFGGNVRLIFEQGSILRFPDADVVDNEYFGGVNGGTGPVILMDDNSQLIFEGNEDRDEGRFQDASGFDKVRCKILGKGQIFLNKNATLRVFDTAAVGIESDTKTPHTDITISIQRQAQMLIGDENNGGGAFQVGNIVDVNLDQNISDAFVNFTLRLDGPDSNFLIEREGFFGLGVGTINKFDNMNGAATLATNPVRNAAGAAVQTGGKPTFTPDPATSWRVMPLFNVNNVEIRLIRGTFDHSNIFDGSDDQASLMAIGPVNGQYTMRLGAVADAVVLGGGNVFFLRTDAPTPFPVNIWSFADPLVGAAEDNGKYSILSSTLPARQMEVDTIGNAAVNSSLLTVAAGTTITTGLAIEGTVITDSKTFIGAATNQVDFFNFITFPNYPLMSPAKFVDLGSTVFDTVTVIVNDGVGAPIPPTPTGSYLADGTNIRRIPDPLPLDTDGNIANAAVNLPIGVLGGTGQANDLGPENFSVLKN